MRIDAHQHFWKFDPVRDSWITEDMTAIRKDFFPQDLQGELRANKFVGCVSVQASQSEEETSFLLNLAADNDFIKGVVGWVDLMHPRAKERLEHFGQFKTLKGFRHVLQGEPQRDIMLQPDFMRGIALLHEFGFTYDILIFADQLKFIPAFVKAFPAQKFIIDHLAKPLIKKQELAKWKEEMATVAHFGNVYCKVSGMVTEADLKGWKKEDFTPYLDAVVESFGVHRLVYGSDWPVCLVAASYKEQLSIVENYFSRFSQDEQAAVFGRTAAAVYNL